MDGEHTLARCCEVTEEVLRTVFNQLYSQRVTLEGMILKPNMALPGLACPQQEEVQEVGIGEQQYQVRLTCRQQEDVNDVADSTVRCLLRTVPAAVPGIAFLSGGQPSRTGLGSFECHECPIQVATALGVGVFLCPRHPATGFRDLARPANSRVGGTASSLSSSRVQSGCPPWRIQCLDGDTSSSTTASSSSIFLINTDGACLVFASGKRWSRAVTTPVRDHSV